MDSKRKTIQKLDVLRELVIDLGGLAMVYGISRDQVLSAVGAYTAVAMAIDVLKDNDVSDPETLAEFANIDSDKTKTAIRNEMVLSAQITAACDIMKESDIH